MYISASYTIRVNGRLGEGLEPIFVYAKLFLLKFSLLLFIFRTNYAHNDFVYFVSSVIIFKLRRKFLMTR